MTQKNAKTQPVGFLDVRLGEPTLHSPAAPRLPTVWLHLPVGPSGPSLRAAAETPASMKYRPRPGERDLRAQRCRQLMKSQPWPGTWLVPVIYPAPLIPQHCWAGIGLVAKGLVSKRRKQTSPADTPLGRNSASSHGTIFYPKPATRHALSTVCQVLFERPSLHHLPQMLNTGGWGCYCTRFKDGQMEAPEGRLGDLA